MACPAAPFTKLSRALTIQIVSFLYPFLTPIIRLFVPTTSLVVGISFSGKVLIKASSLNLSYNIFWISSADNSTGLI